MSTTSDTPAQAAREKLRLAEAQGQGVEELADELDAQHEQVLQERLVALGQQRGIGVRQSAQPPPTSASQP